MTLIEAVLSTPIRVSPKSIEPLNAISHFDSLPVRRQVR